MIAKEWWEKKVSENETCEDLLTRPKVKNNHTTG